MLEQPEITSQHFCFQMEIPYYMTFLSPTPSVWCCIIKSFWIWHLPLKTETWALKRSKMRSMLERCREILTTNGRCWNNKRSDRNIFAFRWRFLIIWLFCLQTDQTSICLVLYHQKFLDLAPPLENWNMPSSETLENEVYGEFWWHHPYMIWAQRS